MDTSGILRDNTESSSIQLPEEENTSHHAPNSSLLHDITRSIKFILSGKSNCCDDDLVRKYMICRGVLPLETLDATIARALLSCNEEFRGFMTHRNMICDPLVLLKCNLKVWKHENLRGLALNIFQEALTRNEIEVQKQGLSKKIHIEYLTCRDMVIALCFISMLSGEYGSTHSEPIYCEKMISILQSILLKRKGLVSSVVKQGLSDKSIDWLVMNIDLSFESEELYKMLDRKDLTILERLRIADLSIKAAVSCHSSDVKVARRLSSSALSVLIQHFFFLLGPVGMPANVLYDESGHDVSHKCQNYMFRIVSSFHKIDGEISEFKNESIHMLSKLLTLCKSEVSTTGLTGVAFHKRKLFLQKIIDCISQAQVCLDSGTTTSSA